MPFLQNTYKPLVALIGDYDKICYREKSSNQSKDSCDRKVCEEQIKNYLQRFGIKAYCSQGHITPMTLSLKASITVLPQVKYSAILWKTRNNQYGSWVDLIFHVSRVNISFHNKSYMKKVTPLNFKMPEPLIFVKHENNPIINEVIPKYTKYTRNNLIFGTMKTHLYPCGPEMSLAQQFWDDDAPFCYLVETNVNFSIEEHLNYLQYQGKLLSLTFSSNYSHVNLYEILIVKKKIHILYSIKSFILFNKLDSFKHYEYATGILKGLSFFKPHARKIENPPTSCSVKYNEISKYNIPEENSEYSFWITSTMFEFYYIYFKAKVIDTSFGMKENSLTWNDASRKCQAVGGYLPILRSKREIDELISVIRDVEALPLIEGLYIGLNNIKVKFCIHSLLINGRVVLGPT